MGSLSSVGPLYNAELAAPEIRGLLVSMQQLTITLGIMVSYWIGYSLKNSVSYGWENANAAI